MIKFGVWGNYVAAVLGMLSLISSPMSPLTAACPPALANQHQHVQPQHFQP